MKSSPPAGVGLRPVAAWKAFWFTPVDPVGLHRLRVLAGLLFLAWLLPLAGHVDSFFGLGGWFDRHAFREAATVAARLREATGMTARPGEETPVPLWSVLYWCQGPAAVRAVYWTSIGVLVLFTLGVCSRLTAPLTYVVVASFTATPATPSDVDPLLVLVAFYLALGYLLLGQSAPGASWRQRLFGPADALLWRRRSAEGRESVGANVALRLLQIHFAVAMVASGLHKLQFADWWYGVAYWFSLHPAFDTTRETLASYRETATSYLGMLSAAAYATLAWQLAFPLFAWRRGLARLVLLGGAGVALVGCAAMLDLPLFGPVVALCCLSYLTPAEWHRLDVLPAPAVPAKGTKAQPSAVSGGHR